MQLNNLEFYVVPTAKINQVCSARQKTISLGKVQTLAQMCRYEKIREYVDQVIDLIKETEET